MIPSRKRAERRAYFATNTNYTPGMYTRRERLRHARTRARRDAARSMRRRQRRMS